MWLVRFIRRYRYVYVRRRRVNGHAFTGEDLKQIGMAQAAAARKQWFVLSQRTISNLPYGATYDSEWLTDQIGLPRGKVEMNRNGAVGSAMNAAGRRGWGIKVGERNSTRPSSHGAVIKIWQRTDRP